MGKILVRDCELEPDLHGLLHPFKYAVSKGPPLLFLIKLSAKVIYP